MMPVLQAEESLHTADELMVGTGAGTPTFRKRALRTWDRQRRREQPERPDPTKRPRRPAPRPNEVGPIAGIGFHLVPTTPTGQVKGETGG